jgi:hypothetical protein
MNFATSIFALLLVKWNKNSVILFEILNFCIAKMRGRIFWLLTTLLSVALSSELISVDQGLISSSEFYVNVEVVANEQGVILDLIGLSETDYVPTDCGIDLGSLYYQLNRDNFSLCLSNNTYTEFENRIWKLHWCEQGNESVHLWFGIEASLFDLFECGGDYYTSKNWSASPTVSYQVVLVSYTDSFASKMEIEMEFHYDTQPGLSNVPGTNYMLSGPMFHSGMPYVKILDYYSFKEDSLSILIENYTVGNLGMAQVSFLSFINSTGSREYFGSMYLLSPGTNMTDIGNPLAKFKTDMTMNDTDSQTSVFPARFELGVDEAEPLVMESYESKGNCTSRQKVIFSNGVYRLSTINWDRCSLHKLILSHGNGREFEIALKSPYMFTLPSGDIAYSSEVPGLILNVASVKQSKLGTGLSFNFSLHWRHINSVLTVVNLEVLNAENSIQINGVKMEWSFHQSGFYYVLNMEFVSEKEIEPLDMIQIAKGIYTLTINGTNGLSGFDNQGNAGYVPNVPTEFGIQFIFPPSIQIPQPSKLRDIHFKKAPSSSYIISVFTYASSSLLLVSISTLYIYTSRKQIQLAYHRAFW